MDSLQTYANIAELLGGGAIIVGGIFALIQLAEFRKRRRYQAAADLCRGFSEPELAKAVTLLKTLPDDARLEDLRSRGPEYEAAAQIVGMTFETMGLLVHMDIASFKVVQELAGGLLLMMWRKIGTWVRETRVEQGNPRFGEWVQWLAERLEEREPEIQPAYQAHANWAKFDN
jgi:hypothetical protein